MPKASGAAAGDGFNDLAAYIFGGGLPILRQPLCLPGHVHHVLSRPVCLGLEMCQHLFRSRLLCPYREAHIQGYMNSRALRVCSDRS